MTVEEDSWLPLPDDAPFGLQNLPYGSFRCPEDGGAHVGVAVGDHLLDLTAVTQALLPEQAALFADGNLDRLLGAGREVWAQVRTAVHDLFYDADVRDQVEARLLPAEQIQMLPPFTVADYVDFYASEHHATNIGRMFRPEGEPLTPNWKHLPIGYHGRAGTVVVSGTDVVRPSGQRRTPAGDVVFGPTTRLDIEAELGFVVGTPSPIGSTVPMRHFTDHVFGACLINDWSARDLQAWEYVPLGPFLGKSFATSTGAWVVPLAALHAARVSPPPRVPRPLPYLDDSDADPWGLEIGFEVRLNGCLISRPPFRTMYWTAAQQLAHMTINGASLRTGDLFASGTISGPQRDQCGSLIELSWQGQAPILLTDGSTRTFLEDGDEVVITASAPGPAGTTIGFGEVRGTIVAGPGAVATPGRSR